MAFFVDPFHVPWNICLPLSRYGGVLSRSDVPAYAISIDGNFSDWSVSQLLGTDVPGDVSDGDPVDWVGLWAAFENNSLFLSYQTRWNIDFVGNSWRYAVFIDVDFRAETGYRGFPGGALVGAEYLIEGGTAIRG